MALRVDRLSLLDDDSLPSRVSPDENADTAIAPRHAGGLPLQVGGYAALPAFVSVLDDHTGLSPSGAADGGHFVPAGVTSFSTPGLLEGHGVTLGDEVAFIGGVSPDGTLPLETFYAWNDDTPATYTGGFTNSRK